MPVDFLKFSETAENPHSATWWRFAKTSRPILIKNSSLCRPIGRTHAKDLTQFSPISSTELVQMDYADGSWIIKPTPLYTYAFVSLERLRLAWTWANPGWAEETGRCGFSPPRLTYWIYTSEIHFHSQRTDLTKGFYFRFCSHFGERMRKIGSDRRGGKILRSLHNASSIYPPELSPVISFSPSVCLPIPSPWGIRRPNDRSFRKIASVGRSVFPLGDRPIWVTITRMVVASRNPMQ